MEGTSSKTDKVNEGGRGRKKKRGGIKFSGAKALRRNALRKMDAPGSCGDDRIVDEVDKNDEDEPGMFRKTIEMRPLNLDVVVENVDGEEEDDGGEKDNEIEEQECRRPSSSRSDSLGFEHDSDEEGIDKVVSSKTLKP